MGDVHLLKNVGMEGSGSGRASHCGSGRDWTEKQVPPPSWHNIFEEHEYSEAILTSTVRKCYLNHLHRTLRRNCTSCSTLPPSHESDLVDYTLLLEKTALQKCMITREYRRVMLGMINDIKQHTKDHKLYFDERKVILKSKHCATELQSEQSAPSSAGPFLTPPADFPNLLSINEQSAEVITHNSQAGPHMSTNRSWDEVCDPHVNDEKKEEECILSDNDWVQIEEEMARLCGDVFSSNNSSRQQDSANSNLKIRASEKKNSSCMESEVLEQNKLHQTPDFGTDEMRSWKKLRVSREEELRIHLEKFKKTASLQKQARLKRKFIQLFGIDELQEQLVSKLTDKEVAQYRERIAPWVVKHLMPMYKQKRIASRVLFKKLAKHIADCLIQRNPTPDECDVWMGVQEFFNIGKGIQCDADIFP